MMNQNSNSYRYYISVAMLSKLSPEFGSCRPPVWSFNAGPASPGNDDWRGFPAKRPADHSAAKSTNIYSNVQIVHDYVSLIYSVHLNQTKYDD